MTMVTVVLAMAHTPAMVWHQNGGMCDVAYQVIQVTVVAETLVAAVHARIATAQGSYELMH